VSNSDLGELAARMCAGQYGVRASLVLSSDGLTLGLRVVLFALAGLPIGSFLTVLVHRLPKGQSIVAPWSGCPRCGVPIRARDNVPVLSYLILRGRCRTCGEPVSIEYPLTELATAGLFAAAGALIEPLYAAVLVAAFLAVMLAVALIDARHRIVPNRIVYPALVIFLGAIVVGHFTGAGVDVVSGLIGLAAYSIPMLLVALVVPGGLGMGDVKLAALIGLVLGSMALSLVGVAAFLGIVGGGLGAVTAVAVLRYGRKQQIPFGPFLAGGAAVAALVGQEIASAYLSLLS
jgi:leader peptidase (prepilin peptidase) / N-methyltransferase